MNRIIDTLQALFPPNRLVVLFAGLVTALAGVVSAWLAAHFPGLALGTTEIAIVLSAVLLIGFRLFDKWLDQWQAGEPINLQADVDAALEEVFTDPDVRKAFVEAHPDLFPLLEDAGAKAAVAPDSRPEAPAPAPLAE